MGVCIVCDSQTTDRVLCETCANDPFSTEEARKRLAAKGDLENLKRLYGPDTAYFPEGAVDKLWGPILLDKDDAHANWNKHRTRTTLTLVPEKFSNCIDIACGWGYALKVLKATHPEMELYGIDLFQAKIDALSKEVDAHLAVANVDQVPFKTRFKLALLMEVLEHVEVPKSQQFLKSIHGLLDDDGQFLISVPAEDDLKQMMYPCPHCGKLTHTIGHVRSFSRELIAAELRMAGFEIVSTLDIAGGKYFGIPRQKLMKYFPQKIRPMVFALRCRKAAAAKP